MKWFVIAIALLFPVSPALAVCGEYTFCNNELDQHVPKNLIRLLKSRQEDDSVKFWRKLGCQSEGNEATGRIVCDVDGEDVVYEWTRQADYKPDAILIMVPAPEYTDAKFPNL